MAFSFLRRRVETLEDNALADDRRPAETAHAPELGERIFFFLALGLVLALIVIVWLTVAYTGRRERIEYRPVFIGFSDAGKRDYYLLQERDQAVSIRDSYALDQANFFAIYTNEILRDAVTMQDRWREPDGWIKSRTTPEQYKRLRADLDEALRQVKITGFEQRVRSVRTTKTGDRTIKVAFETAAIDRNGVEQARTGWNLVIDFDWLPKLTPIEIDRNPGGWIVTSTTLSEASR